jgi:hypothetical protein
VDEPSLVARLAEQGVNDFELSAPVQLVGWYHDDQLGDRRF